MSAFEYQGISISIDSDGNFTAELCGETVRKPSLKALKQYLKENKADTFKPFDAFDAGNNIWNFEEEPRRIRVIGFERTKNRTHSLHTFKTADGPSRWHRNPSEVLADTAENAKVISEILRLIEERDRIENEHNEKISDLRHQLAIIKVTDFVKEI